MMKSMLGFLLDVLTPRFIEEDVAFYDDGDRLQPMFKVEEAREGDPVEYVGRVRSFQLMGFALGGRLMGGFVEYGRWKELKEAGRLVDGRVRFSDWGDSP